MPIPPLPGDPERIEEIRRYATQPLEAFNKLNNIGKAYAYGSDVGYLLRVIDSQAAEIARLRDIILTADRERQVLVEWVEDIEEPESPTVPIP